MVLHSQTQTSAITRIAPAVKIALQKIVATTSEMSTTGTADASAFTPVAGHRHAERARHRDRTGDSIR